MKNGAAPAPTKPAEKPAPPAEASSWVLYATPPQISEEMRQTFKAEEFLAELREAEQTGWPELKDLIHDLEQELTSRG